MDLFEAIFGNTDSENDEDDNMETESENVVKSEAANVTKLESTEKKEAASKTIDSGIQHEAIFASPVKHSGT